MDARLAYLEGYVALDFERYVRLIQILPLRKPVKSAGNHYKTEFLGQQLQNLL
jgi:hypothetical protein